MAELRTPMYQRVYQYLQYFDSKDVLALDQFVFVGTLEGTDKDCLKTIIRFTHLLVKYTYKDSHIGILKFLTPHGKRYVTLFGF